LTIDKKFLLIKTFSVFHLLTLAKTHTQYTHKHTHIYTVAATGNQRNCRHSNQVEIWLKKRKENLINLKNSIAEKKREIKRERERERVRKKESYKKVRVYQKVTVKGNQHARTWTNLLLYVVVVAAAFVARTT